MAHEYWLDPIDSSVVRGKSAIVDVRNGQDYSGSAFPYDSKNFHSVSVNNQNGNTEFKARLGDYPAIHPELLESGLYSVNVQTTAKMLVYENWKKFDTFLNYHGLDDVRAQHEERNLPKNGINERYYRSAKTIIQVNDSGELMLDDAKLVDINNHNAFAPTDALFEMVLLDNPYSDIDIFRIRLLYNAEPLPNRQVELFWKTDELTRLTTITDAQGVANFQMLGHGDYLLNAVQVSIPEQDDVHWLSHWASITFER